MGVCPNTGHIEAQLIVYDHASEHTGQQWARVHARRRRILSGYVDLSSVASVLEIGCHGGEFLAGLGGPATRRTGIDISRSLVERASGKPGVVAIRADVSAGIPVRSAAVSLVVMTEVIEHIIDTDALLNDIRRVLTPGGHLLISTPNIRSLKNRLLLLKGGYPNGPEFRAGGAGHVRVYSDAVLARQLEERGFQVLLRCGLNFIPDCVLRATPMLDGIDRYFAARVASLCSNTHIVARKA